MPRKRGNDDDRKNGVGALIAVIAGGVVLLCCLCGGIAVGGWFLDGWLTEAAAQRAAVDQAELEAWRAEVERPKVGKVPPPIDGPQVDPMQAMLDQRFAEEMRHWKVLRSEVGKFSVELPAKSVDQNPVVGDQVALHTGGAIVNQMASVISRQRVGDAGHTPLQAAEAGAAIHIQEPKNKKLLTLQGHAGVEVRSDNGKRAVRCYATATRVYTILVLTHQAPRINQEFEDRVFNSFRILE